MGSQLNTMKQISLLLLPLLFASLVDCGSPWAWLGAEQMPVIRLQGSLGERQASTAAPSVCSTTPQCVAACPICTTCNSAPCNGDATCSLPQIATICSDC